MVRREIGGVYAERAIAHLPPAFPHDLKGKPESRAAKRDEVLKRMLKMPPKPHVERGVTKSNDRVRTAKRKPNVARMPTVIQIRGSLKTETRLGTEIPNTFDRSPLTAGKMAECEKWRQIHSNADHRRRAMSSSYNCHG